MPMNQYEIDTSRHRALSAPESMVLLRSDGSFPLPEADRLALYGSGARRTIKGGTGSGDVNSVTSSPSRRAWRRPATLTTKAWLDAYDAVHERAHADFIADLKARARAAGVPAVVLRHGRRHAEPEHDLPLDTEGVGAPSPRSTCSAGSPARATTGAPSAATCSSPTPRSATSAP